MEYKIRKCTEAGVKGGGKVKYCATLYYQGTKTTDDFVKWAEKRSSVTESDIKAVIYNLIAYIETECEQGYKIDYGDLGKYYPSMCSKAVDTPEEVIPETIKNVKVRYKMSHRIKCALRSIKFKKATKVYI
jgi:predicted histone-like DNA-binding protein